MTVDDVFFIRGRGAVATGRIEQGTLRTGDEVLIGGNGPFRVDGIEMFRKVLDEAHEGDNVGLLFKQLDRDQIPRGAIVTAGDDSVSAFAPPSPTDAAPIPVATATGTSGSDPRFASVAAQRAQFLEMRQAGLMTDAQVDESLRSLIFVADRRQWLLKARDETWYSSVDGGEQWRPDTPPAA
jgi:translation elongation factor EF-1alpha